MQGLSDVSINIVPGHRSFPIWLLQPNSSTSDRVIDHLILAGYLVVTRHRGLPYRALNIWGAFLVHVGYGPNWKIWISPKSPF